MTGFGQMRADARAALVDLARAHSRTILPVAVVVIAGMAASLLLLLIYAGIIGPTAFAQVAALADAPEPATTALIWMMVPAVIGAILAIGVWAGVVVQIASGAIARRRTSIIGAVGRSILRLPAALLTGLIVLVGVVLSIVLTPVIVVAGILGLIATPFVRSRWDRWPASAVFIVMAIPFGAALWMLAHTCLALPSIWLSRPTPRAALRDAAERARGREARVVVAFLASIALTLGLTQGLVALVSLTGLGGGADFAAQVAALVLIGPFVLVTLTLLYHRGGPAPALPPVAAPRQVSRTSRIAVATAIALVLPISVVGSAAPAQAVGTKPVSMTISTNPDTPFEVGPTTTISVGVRDTSSETQQPTGSLRILINDVEQTGPFVLPGTLFADPVTFDRTFGVGTYRIDAYYLGDETYAPSTWSYSIEVTPPTLPPVPTSTQFVFDPASATAAGAPVTAKVTVTAEGGVAPLGWVRAYPGGGGDLLGEARLDAAQNGYAEISMTLPPGLNNVKVYFEGDAGFESSSIDETHQVLTAPSTITASTSPTVVGQGLTVSATVSALYPATGSVSFEAFSAGAPGVAIPLGSAPISAGTATLFAPDLPLGTYSIVATYAGDASVQGATSDPVSHTVGKSAVTVGVTSPTVGAIVGGIVRLAITVAAAAPGTGIPTGTVTVTRDGTTVASSALVGGSITLDVPAGSAGDREFTVEYAGNADYQGGSGSLTYAVGKVGSSTLFVDLDDRTFAYGTSQTFTGRVEPASGTTIPSGTVELLLGGTSVGTASLDGTGAFSFTSDSIPVLASSALPLTANYLGDSDHATSSTLAGREVQVTVTKRLVTPVITVESTDPIGVGSTVDLVVTIPEFGSGPGGSVSFSTIGSPLGTVPVVNGEARIPYTIVDATTRILATYSGDTNYTSNAITDYVIDASKAAVTVVLTSDAPFTYGTYVNLIADVAVGGGGVPGNGVEFRTTTNTLKSNVPVVAGKATLQVCIGDSVVCTDPGIPILGTAATNLTARYPEGASNLEGVSDAVPFALIGAATTIALTVTPTILQPGHGLLLSAKVTGPNPTMIPWGTVAFYGKETTPSGEKLVFIAGGALDERGEISTTSSVGNGVTELQWPAESIVAQYAPGPAPYAGSRDEETITLTRIATIVTLSVSPASPAANAVVTVDAALSHAPGVSYPFTGSIVFTSNTGESCTAFLPDRDCTFQWTTTTTRTVTAEYSGDIIYTPQSSSFDVDLQKGASALRATAPTTVGVGENVTVRWNLGDANATGNVTVTAGSTVWCTVPVTTNECSGQFDAAAAGSSELIFVRYEGDANWTQTQEELPITVSTCAVLDVRSASGLGTVTVDTPPNCGLTGYTIGSNVQVTARPTGTNQFVNWLGYRPAGLVPVSETQTTTFTLTAESESWVHVATFRVPCYPVTGDITGVGALFVTPASNCALPGGGAGYTLGTTVKLSYLPRLNPQYNEPDAFYRFGSLPGAAPSIDVSGIPWLTYTVMGATVVPLVFGPQCHVVTVQLSPAGAGDVGRVTTPTNCASPAGTGYLRGTSVSIEATPGDTDRALASWSVDGTVDATLPRTSPTQFTIPAGNPTVTANFATCYTLDLVIDGAMDPRGRDIGQVTNSTAPNCIDGSERYAADTVVTLTPEILVDKASFTGWDGVKTELTPTATGGTGVVTAGVLKHTMTASVTKTANFFLASVCSSLVVRGERALLSLAQTGCGVGYYFDEQKVNAIRNGTTPAEQWQSSRRTELRVTIPPTQSQDVYVTVTGDTRACFNRADGFAGPSTDLGAKSFGPMTGTATCAVGGPIRIDVQSCQTVTIEPKMITEDGGVYAWDVPGTMYLPNPDGSLGGYSMGDFRWVDSVPVSFLTDGSMDAVGQRSGACKDSGTAFVPDTDLAFIPTTVSRGFTFVGWEEGDNLNIQTPLVRTTTATERSMTVVPVYVAECYTLTLGPGISVEPDAPYCPGSSPSDGRFIAGAAVPIRAQYQFDGRWFEKWIGGTVGGQDWEDKPSLDIMSYVFMDQDKNIRGYYPSSTQRVTLGIAQTFKIISGILAVAAPIVLGMLFPPAGILFGILGAAAGISALAGNDKAAAVFDLINPTKILTCAARWAFSNTDDPTGKSNIGNIVGTANKMRQVLMGTDITKVNISNAGGLAGSAGFVLGLYSAGIASAPLDPQTSEELADTVGMTTCLNQQWRAAGSDIQP